MMVWKIRLVFWSSLSFGPLGQHAIALEARAAYQEAGILPGLETISVLEACLETCKEKVPLCLPFHVDRLNHLAESFR